MRSLQSLTNAFLFSSHFVFLFFLRHVLNYAQALSRLWPKLERTVRDVDLKHQQSSAGIVCTRTPVPLELRREWSLWDPPSGANFEQDQTTCVDGEIATVLKVYREVLAQREDAGEGDAGWLRAMWPHVVRIMRRWMGVLDRDGNGLVQGAQPNTYDVPNFGIMPFITGYYLAALKATAAMCALVGGEESLAQECEARLASGSALLDELCFGVGGRQWYTQVPDPDNPVNETGNGSFIDALVGLWWANRLQLGWLLPKAHVAASIENTFNNNHTDSFDPAIQAPRKFYDSRDAGMYICRWPKGTAVPKSPLLYSMARQDSAEDFSRLDALLYTAMAWIFIPAYCFALP